ncbi:MAG: hypothetical protein ACXWFB_10990, partial [Nitrososphaeraceae archaeon]
MKLLCDHILNEYGFTENLAKSTNIIKIFSRDNFEIVFKQGQYSYSILGIDYPLCDLPALKKIRTLNYLPS